ncbi:uncharacterized protein LOC111626883 [Centruroides sculpturatus]|uniref:uncharacterized protein LOC111626883 n=1 Tax=Centruroides sculpturatus TaxID=218467 RepID=UPI000C6E9FF5|nr:uncharacterized protein LOC111626883 [Centruroides sculpturatus]
MQMSIWQGRILIGADASKSRIRTSIGIVLPDHNIRETWLLHNYCSVYGAEALGIKRALHLSSSLDGPSVICSDSKSAIQEIGNISFSSPALLIDIADNISQHPKPIEIGWTPGHVGIDINEAMDRAARTDTPSGSWRGSLMARNLIREYREKQKIEITELWSEHLRNKGRDHLRPFAPWPYRHTSSRNAETLLARLRTDTAPLNGFLCSRNLCASPDCPHCGAQETSGHFWLMCPRYTEARQELACTLKIDLAIIKTLTPIYWARTDLSPRQHVQALERYVARTYRFD